MIYQTADVVCYYGCLLNILPNKDQSYRCGRGKEKVGKRNILLAKCKYQNIVLLSVLFQEFVAGIGSLGILFAPNNHIRSKLLVFQQDLVTET